ncbi:putative DNA recombination and repair protein RecA [Helianthus annuus]|uniref:DNA recombination and repair protein RecA n=1 Tax=Helianthus annuus TaxID=4232 RepID=A0A9K3JD52_HELAN|nr:putative DNA recombination and repair protein RecA [Helianthus annuus]KAJ0582732.1 putative DNA recombination and repair protein RecA [Helianthus annuus]KAJ0598715.1 putative DNA recombination and repair protein RecA [Helianthus annuus]KAJ0762966.1 putative DNA recombination and repair protein RecA [Helianthus annuus]KAJ0933262.1 putative DNA recombination and repair protein RecA [Helianthus annuus]
MSKKDLALKQAIDQINTSHGKGSIMFLGQCASPRQVPVVSTGSFALDIALGVGGFPKVSCHIHGRILIGLWQGHGPDKSRSANFSHFDRYFLYILCLARACPGFF